MCDKEYQPIFSRSARTATSTVTVPCCSSQGLFFINVTAVSATPSVTFAINGVSPTDAGTTYNILTSAAITGTGLTVLRVSPHLTAAANTIAKDILPSALSITATHADADSITYEVGFIGLE